MLRFKSSFLILLAALTLSVAVPTSAQAQFFNNPIIRPYLKKGWNYCWTAICETADGYYLEYCAPAPPMRVPTTPVTPTPQPPSPKPAIPYPLCSNIPICPDGMGDRGDEPIDWDGGCMPPLPQAGSDKRP